jgi:hypothetical protein
MTLCMAGSGDTTAFGSIFKGRKITVSVRSAFFVTTKGHLVSIYLKTIKNYTIRLQKVNESRNLHLFGRRPQAIKRPLRKGPKFSGTVQGRPAGSRTRPPAILSAASFETDEINIRHGIEHRHDTRREAIEA